MRWFLSIDPGRSLGWALWRDSSEVGLDNSKIECTHSGVLHVDESVPEDQWAPEMIRAFREFYSRELAGIDISGVAMEGISFWGMSGRSFAAMAKGDTIQTAYVVGALMDLFIAKVIDEVRVVDVRKWKGQMNTLALNAAIRRLTGKGYVEHEREAVGIGLWYAGKL